MKPTLEITKQLIDNAGAIIYHYELDHWNWEECRLCGAKESSRPGTPPMKHEPGCLYEDV